MALQIDDIRYWIKDRTPADNPLKGDLYFPDPEIVQAMRRAAWAFNDIPPYSMEVSPNALPDNTNIFIEASAQILYEGAIHSLGRNALKYAGGNVVVDTDNEILSHLEKRVKELDRWKQTAQMFKVKADNSRYYRSLGGGF